MSITYEANLNCDGKDCKTRPITGCREVPRHAKKVVLYWAERADWVTIDDEHYCPDCAELIKPDLKEVLEESISRQSG